MQRFNKIVVYEREIINGVRTQKIEIEYNFVNKKKRVLIFTRHR